MPTPTTSTEARHEPEARGRMRKLIAGLVALAVAAGACSETSSQDTTSTTNATTAPVETSSTTTTTPAASTTTTSPPTTTTTTTTAPPAPVVTELVDGEWVRDDLFVEWPTDEVMTDSLLGNPYGPPFLLEIVEIDGRLIAAGIANDRLTIWESSDAVVWRVRYHEPNTRTPGQEAVDAIGGILEIGSSLVVYTSVFDDPRDGPPFVTTIQLVSEDRGETWVRSEAARIDGSVVNVVETSSGWVAVGRGRTEDQSRFATSPSIWLSTDGAAFELVAHGAEGLGTNQPFMRQVAEVDGVAVALGSDSSGVPVWRSVDGLEWNAASPATATGEHSARLLVVHDDRFVLFASQHVRESPQSTLWVSGDGGAWSLVTSTDELPDGLLRFVSSTAAHADGLLVSAVTLARPRPDHCFVDADTCERFEPSLLWTDIETWSQVPLPDRVGDSFIARVFTFDDVVHVHQMLALDQADTHRYVSWRFTGDLPLEEIAQPTLPRFERPLLPDGPVDVSVGDEYRVAVVIEGCGSGLNINGTWWNPTNLPGTVPISWQLLERNDQSGQPYVELYAVGRLVDSSTFEVSDYGTGELLLVYEPDGVKPVCPLIRE